MPTPPPRQDPDALAAVDLGSNSFHMVVARESDGQLQMLDRLRERVGLGEGLTPEGTLAFEVQARALECLQRFGQRLTGILPSRVRAVGTATFRKLKRGRELLRGCEQALGVPVEVVSGKEEARLIYLGVAHTLPEDRGRRLVVDIGGGSTECIVGDGFETERERSLSMGCISWSRTHFDGGKLTRKRFERAEVEARLQLEGIEREFRDLGWQAAFGASGTILAIEEVCQRQGWCSEGIGAPALARLTDALVAAGHVEALQLVGLKDERRPVLAGGVAILRAVFAGLGVKQMATTKGSLRDGVLYDLLGRIHHEDVRARSVAGFARRFCADEAQSARVKAMALALLDQVAEPWRLGQDDRSLLAWAAQLHEVGLAVAWASYHEHGSYLVAHADLPGFSRQEQALLALLVRCHRRRVPAGEIEAVAPKEHKRARRLILLLRLAARMHRSRLAAPLPVPRLGVEGSKVELRFPPGWLAQNPLVEADLTDEAFVLEPLGFDLRVG